jgi:hypothetical protein
MSNFNSGLPVVSTLESPYLAEATSAIGWNGNLGSNGNVWRLNFDSALSVPFDAQFRYLLEGNVVNMNTWSYNGSGTGDNPVSSWRMIDNDSFTPVPEPGTLSFLCIGGLLLVYKFSGRFLPKEKEGEEFPS